MMKITYVSLLILLSPRALLLGQTQTQGPDLRAQLRAIDYRHVSNLDDYLARCRRVQDLIPRLAEFYKEGDAKRERLLAQHHDNPQLVKLGNFITALNKMDEEGLALLRQEMALASQMSTMPPGERQSFFEHKIVPVQKEEDALAKKEVQMALDAKQNGTPLPLDIDKNLNGMRSAK